MKISDVILRISIIILIVEFFVMQILNLLPANLHHIEEALLDSFLLVLFSSPFIYIFVIKTFIDMKDEALKNYAYLLSYDPLTSLPNKSKFLELLSNSIQISSNKHISIMLFDIDHFKVIHEAFGFEAEQWIIKEVISRIHISFREENILIARADLNQLFFLFDEKTDDNLYNYAKKILHTLEKPIHYHEHKISLSGSIGICRYLKDAKTEHDMFKHAHSAMRKAKSNEPDRISFYSQSLTDKVHEAFALDGDMRTALKDKQFFLLYQPKISAKTNEIVGVEALIRWEHPRKGLISPNDFIHLAEENGLIVSIGEWVIVETLKVLKDLIESGKNIITFSINLSGRQLTSKNIDNIIRILQTSKVPLQYIDFEITETYLMKDVIESQVLLKKLHETGVSLSMDDFGSGYSSLAYLKKFSVDYIKIDRGLIKDIESDSNDLSIVKSIIVMGHALGLEVIAEGVETQTQIEMLKDIGCDYFQGYYFSKPVHSTVLFE